MSQKPRRTFTAEQKAQAVAIVQQSGKPISHVAQEMGLTESALRQWVKQATIDQGGGNQGAQNSFIVGVNCPSVPRWDGKVCPA